MEMFELRYFLAVANGENVNRAAERIHVSAGSLSKAIARLEDELKTPLFYKTGRQIRLTPEGQLLKKRASAILQLEEDTRLELAGKESGSLNLFLSAEEVLHASFGIEVAKKVDGIFPQVRTQFLIRHDAGVIDQVMQGEAQLGLITAEAPSGLASKVLARVEFVTAASKRHPLHRKFGTKPIPISEVLEHAFVAPESSILGSIRRGDSRDGWREDKLPKKSNTELAA